MLELLTAGLIESFGAAEPLSLFVHNERGK